LLLLVPSLTTAQLIGPIAEESFPALYSNDSVRPKRQLFREDIPETRPLSGNLYAQHHGFPHPGRWADGQRSRHKPSARLPPPHQAYIDMLDGSRRGRYYGNSYSGGYNNKHRTPSPTYNPHGLNYHHHQQELNNNYHNKPQTSVSFGSDIFHTSGGASANSNHNNNNKGVRGGSHYSGPPKSHQQLDFPQFDLKNVAFGIHPDPSQYEVPKVPQGPVDLKAITFGQAPGGGSGEYGPPHIPPVGPTGPSSAGFDNHEISPEYETSQPTKPSHYHNNNNNNGDEEQAYILQHALSQDDRKNSNKPVKAIVHYHPVEYGNIINIPEKGPQEDEYSSGGGSFGSSGPGDDEGPSSGPPSSQYGPPNHSGGPPLGPSSYSTESGFIPSKGPEGGHDHNSHHDDSSGGSKENPFAPYRFPSSAPGSTITGSFFHTSQEGSNFDPFKFFSNSNSRPSYGPPPKQYTSNQIEHDLPVAIPILAQFHTAKPIKFSKFKRPLHLVYGHIHRPHPPQQHYQHSPQQSFRHPPHHYERGSNFYNRIPKHPRWMSQHGLKK